MNEWVGFAERLARASKSGYGRAMKMTPQFPSKFAPKFVHLSWVFLAASLLSVAPSARAETASSDPLVPAFALKVEAHEKGNAIHLVPPAGHHLNEKAPIHATQGKRPLSVEDPEASGAWILGALNSTAQTHDAVTVEAFICDDGGSYCVKKKSILSADFLKGLSGTGGSVAAAESVAGPKHGLELGFILNDPEKAFALAKSEKKPILIDFYGIWCPPCNVMDETVFRAPEFQKFVKSRFVLLKLDADSELAWKWREAYRIRGYPTIVAADLNGEEIGRVVGSRRPAPFRKWLQESYELRLQPVKADLKKAEAGDATAQFRMGDWAKERGEWSDADRWFSKAQAAGNWPKDDHRWLPYFEVKIALAKEQDAKGAHDHQVAALEDAVARAPESMELADWSSTLAQEYDDQKKPSEQKRALEKSLSTLDRLLKTPGGFNSDGKQEAEVEDLLEMKADALKGLSREDEARAVFLEAASIYARKVASLGGKDAGRERGWNLSRAYCLREAGKRAEARTLYQQLVKKYPEEFTFHYAYARLLVSGKEWKEALPEAQAAYRPSYGDNRLRATQLLAQVQKELGQNAQALQLIRQTIKDFPAPPEGSNRPNHGIEALKKAEAELASAAK